MSCGPLSAIQLNLRQELAASVEQEDEEEEEENTTLSLLALMQKEENKKSGIWPLVCLRESTLSSFVFVQRNCRKLNNIKKEYMYFLVLVDSCSLLGHTNL